MPVYMYSTMPIPCCFQRESDFAMCDSLHTNLCLFSAAKCSNIPEARIEAKWNLVFLEIFYCSSSTQTLPEAQRRTNINKINGELRCKCQWIDIVLYELTGALIYEYCWLAQLFLVAKSKSLWFGIFHSAQYAGGGRSMNWPLDGY